MFRLKLVPEKTSIDFMSYTKLATILSALLMVAAIGLFMLKGLNLGIDFKGGILIEARSEQPADIAALRGTLGQLNLGEIALQSFGKDTDILVRIQRQEGDESAQIKAIQAVTKALGDGFEIRRTEFVGPTIGAELAQKGIMAVLCALGAIMVYIWFRFEWQFSIAAIIALTHDVISLSGCLR